MTDEMLDENELIAQRKAKLVALREQGQAYPNQFKRNAMAKEIHDKFADCSTEQLAALDEHFVVAGRLMTRRMMGKASFIHVQDQSGQIQIYCRRDDLPEGVYQQFKTWDIGDIVGVKGFVFKTKTGELSLHATDISLLSKSLRPLPDKFHGLADLETCYRQRYLDLMMNEKTRNTFVIRSKIVEGIREFLTTENYIEVETPMMQVIPGGATARPFITKHNVLDMDLYLRIAPELYLKRLVVGGIERVFEINRNFRNEGISTQHNPEFTMLEFYQAYAVYTDLMDLTENLLRFLAQRVLGTTIIHYQEHDFDLAKPFARLSMRDAILQFNPTFKPEDIDDLTSASEIAQQLGVAIKPSYGLGKIQTEIFEKTVEKNLIQPTFITEYPAEVSPLARRNDDNPFITDRFEFFVAGREIANGFSELNDPEDQAERFQQQVKEKDAGDVEAMHFDADYIRALEYGMPPTAGEGIGIDRLVMLFTNSASIRDVILFPHMRHKEF